jgi:UDP-GlcNAc:undecaprenyl-phosphate GlcNAc-1-phosphate transferase
MTIGLVLGALSIEGSMKGPTAMALAVPLSILVLPILDTVAAIARRKLTGRSIYTTDRGHLHHCLLRTGMNRPLVLCLVFLLGMIAIAGAVATTLLRHDVYSIAAAAIVVAILVMSRLFGYAEVMLLKAKFQAIFALFRHGNHVGHSHQSEVRLQGTVHWQGVWEKLTAAAFQYNLRTLCLDVNAPAMHEGYHARWDRFGSNHDEELHDWSADLPIHLDDRVIGRLSAVGLCDSNPIWIKLQQLAEIVKTTEQQIHRLVDQLSAPPVKTMPAFGKTIGAAS